MCLARHGKFYLTKYNFIMIKVSEIRKIWKSTGLTGDEFSQKLGKSNKYVNVLLTYDDEFQWSERIARHIFHNFTKESQKVLRPEVWKALEVLGPVPERKAKSPTRKKRAKKEKKSITDIKNLVKQDLFELTASQRLTPKHLILTDRLLQKIIGLARKY